MYPSGPDIEMKGKSVFVEEGGVVVAEKYLNCILDVIRNHSNIDILE